MCALEEGEAAPLALRVSRLAPGGLWLYWICLLKVLWDAEVRRASSGAAGNCCFCCYGPHNDEIFIRLMSKLEFKASG